MTDILANQQSKVFAKLHPSRLEWRGKLPEKLHRVTAPLVRGLYFVNETVGEVQCVEAKSI